MNNVWFSWLWLYFMVNITVVNLPNHVLVITLTNSTFFNLQTSLLLKLNLEPNRTSIYISFSLYLRLSTLLSNHCLPFWQLPCSHFFQCPHFHFHGLSPHLITKCLTNGSVDGYDMQLGNKNLMDCWKLIEITKWDIGCWVYVLVPFLMEKLKGKIVIILKMN